MKEIIIERIQEIAKEINELLEDREKISAQMRAINDNITAKQGAIYELKGLLDFQDSINKEES